MTVAWGDDAPLPDGRVALCLRTGQRTRSGPVFDASVAAAGRLPPD